MSRHRTRSVLGVEYERLTGDELVTSQSVLGAKKASKDQVDSLWSLIYLNLNIRHSTL